MFKETINKESTYKKRTLAFSSKKYNNSAFRFSVSYPSANRSY
jgi:hypothetical protein